MLSSASRHLRDVVRREDGFTVIEVMVAITVFALISMGVSAGIVSTMYLTQDNRSREAALNLASQEIDEARSTKDVFTLDDDTSSQDVAGETYSIARATNWINSDGSDKTCGAGTGVLAYKRIAVTVSWTSGTSPRQKSVVLDTLVSPSSSVSSATSSAIVVGVQTSTGGPNEGVKVTITPTSGGAGTLNAQPAPTDGNGCTYALGVKPGTYTVAIAKSGNIDKDRDATPEKSVTTTAGGTGNQTFVYDRPTTVTSNYAVNAPAGAKLPTSMTTTFVHGSDVVTSSTSTTSLFPYSEGWTAVAGSYTSTCKDVDPSTWPTAPSKYVADPGLRPKTGTTAGAVDSVDLPMGVFDVKMSGLDTVLVATVKNTTAVANGDPGCDPSTTYTFSGLNAAKATTVALPYGTWTLRGTTKLLGGVLSTDNPAVAATPSAKNVIVTVSGTVVTLDPRTVPPQ